MHLKLSINGYHLPSLDLGYRIFQVYLAILLLSYLLFNTTTNFLKAESNFSTITDQISLLVTLTIWRIVYFRSACLSSATSRSCITIRSPVQNKRACYIASTGNTYISCPVCDGIVRYFIFLDMFIHRSILDMCFTIVIFLYRLAT